MAQPTTVEVNGVSEPDHADNGALAVPGKRKRDLGDNDDHVNGDVDVKPTLPNTQPTRNEDELVKSFYHVLKRYESSAFDAPALPHSLAMAPGLPVLSLP